MRLLFCHHLFGVIAHFAPYICAEMANWLQFPFRKKSAEAPAPESQDKEPQVRQLTRIAVVDPSSDGTVVEKRADGSPLDWFYTLPEVFFPIDFIAKRISECHYDLRRVRDDSLVICDRTGAGKFLRQPNALMSWRELVYQHFVYKLADGNAYMRAAMAESVTPDAPIYRWCDNFWELPADKIQIKTNNYGGYVPMFGIAEKDEIIKGYQLNYGSYSMRLIPPAQVWHDRDNLLTRSGSQAYIKSSSRLMAVRKNVANLMAVYAARNVIYQKRGALGFLYSMAKDDAGTRAMTPKEKAGVLKDLDNSYGLDEGKSPYGITTMPLGFIRTNLSIAELQPFEETLEDSVKIASIFGIPSVLVPRKDQATFSNQDTAEKAVYTSVIIPMAKRFCEDLTRFLRLDEAGYYLDCDFSEVACMQAGLKEQTEVDKLVNEVAQQQFSAGLITFNDWRGRIHEPALEGDIFNKVKFEMTPEEIALVDSIIKNQSPIQINTSAPDKEGNNDNNTNP